MVGARERLVKIQEGLAPMQAYMESLEEASQRIDAQFEKESILQEVEQLKAKSTALLKEKEHFERLAKEEGDHLVLLEQKNVPCEQSLKDLREVAREEADRRVCLEAQSVPYEQVYEKSEVHGTKVQELERSHAVVVGKLSKQLKQLEKVNETLKSDSVQKALSEQVSRLQVKLEALSEESQRLVQEETQHRLSLSAHLKIMQDERDVFLKQLEEDAEAKRNLSKQIATLQAEVSDLKYGLEKSDVCLESVEEQKREVQEELKATRQQYEEKTAACDKLEKVKVHIQQELEGASVKLGLQKELVSRLRKTQQLCERQLTVEKIRSARYVTECERDEEMVYMKETEVLTVTPTLKIISEIEEKLYEPPAGGVTVEEHDGEILKEVEAINLLFCLQTDVYDELEKFTVSLQQKVDISVELGYQCQMVSNWEKKQQMVEQWLTEGKSGFPKVAKERRNQRVRTEVPDWISAKTGAEKSTLIREKSKGVAQRPVEEKEILWENIEKEALTLKHLMKVVSEEKVVLQKSAKTLNAKVKLWKSKSHFAEKRVQRLVRSRSQSRQQVKEKGLWKSPNNDAGTRTLVQRDRKGVVQQPVAGLKNGASPQGSGIRHQGTGGGSRPALGDVRNQECNVVSRKQLLEIRSLKKDITSVNKRKVKVRPEQKIQTKQTSEVQEAKEGAESEATESEKVSQVAAEVLEDL
ncbi:myosin-9-like [Eleutherodactylus coqui]|uniref:myosin-9-like n=1 Tax=Eleutherodactylus coqui TaxID=57060 RepID=UPI003462A90C